MQGMDFSSIVRDSNADRVFCWRFALGVWDGKVTKWKAKVNSQTQDYIQLKQDTYSSITSNGGFDPLLGECDETQSFYESMEKKRLIQLDLSRIDEELFYQQRKRCDILLNVLFLWSMKHSRIGYRQGMHEIAAIILYCLEYELELWSVGLATDGEAAAATTDGDGESFSYNSLGEIFMANQGYDIEAQCYWLFALIMREMEYLYDPTPVPPPPPPASSSSTSPGSSHPHVVHYLTEFQETYLYQLDPELCLHLRECDIHAQFYGLRWSRLLLGREFPLSQVLLLWDYLFVGKKEGGSRDRENGRIVVGGVQPYSPVLVRLREVMLAMLLLIRSALLAGDETMALGFLMKFPKMDDITPVMVLVERIQHASACGRPVEGLSLPVVTANTAATTATTKDASFVPSKPTADGQNSNIGIGSGSRGNNTGLFADALTSATDLLFSSGLLESTSSSSSSATTNTKNTSSNAVTATSTNNAPNGATTTTASAATTTTTTAAAAATSSLFAPLASTFDFLSSANASVPASRNKQLFASDDEND